MQEEKNLWFIDGIVLQWSKIMITFSFIFAVISAIIYLVWFIPYIYHTFRGRVVPHAFSWSVWGTLSLINTVWLSSVTHTSSALISPVIRTTALIIGATIGWMLIKKVRINRYDYLCIWMAGLVLLYAYYVWAIKAIIPTILIDILVLLPTLKKIWFNPRSEDALAWITTTVSQFFLLLSIGVFTIETSLFWFYAMSMNALVAIYITLRIRYVENWRFRLKQFFSFFS